MIEFTDRYWIIAYNNYYPFGGLDDVKVTVKHFGDAIDEFEGYKGKYDYVQLYDNMVCAKIKEWKAEWLKK